MNHTRILIAALALALAACGGPKDSTPQAAPTGMANTAALQNKAASGNPWDVYMLAPATRTLTPVAVYTTSGTVSNPTNVLSGSATRISGTGSYITLDFGKEVAGIVTLSFADASTSNESVGLAFTESNAYVGPLSDGSNSGLNDGASSSTDGAIYAAIATTSASSYTMPTKSLRGGFRYLTLFMNSSGWVDITNVSLNFTAAPLMANPSAYPNYFYSSDSLLNQLWYAGAYTVQTSTIAPTQGRQLVGTGWDNSAVISGGASVLSDAAKRDRTVWSGDLGISGATAYVSTADTVSVKNAMQQMYDSQLSSGEMPYGGPPFNLYGSDTYHIWSLIGTYNYYLYSGDAAWVSSIWSKYKIGMTFITNKVNGAHGLLNVTGTNDWARGDQGGENIEANAMLYRAYVTGAILATLEGDSATASSYTSAAATLKTHINSTLWDASIGAYIDNPTSTMHPQDGNSLAVWFGVTDTAGKPASIAAYLNSNLGTFGALTPEWGNNISNYAGSMQLMAMSSASADVETLNLIRRQWGNMYNNADTTKTFWEGVNANGSIGYVPWFVSHSHGWATGPTSALTFFTLGINPTAVNGTQYNVIPHPGDLTHVEGQLTVNTGKLIKNTYNHNSDGSFTMTVDSSSNTGSVGVIGVPKFGLARTITLNGVQVWNGSVFSGAAGIASADQDNYYVYFRGVQPAVMTFAYSAETATWNTCATETGQCVFNGTKGVRYGSGSTFVYASFTDGVTCSNATFGDPTYGVAKHCELSDTVLPPAIGVWTLCASEAGQCAFSNTQTVAFGANLTYNYALETGGAACTDAVFKDPLFGVVKSCYVGILPQNPGFETPVTTSYTYNPANALWTFTAQNGNGGSGIQINNGPFGATLAPQGVQTAFLQDGASITQVMSNLPAGSYAINFQAARRSYGGQQTFGVYIDGAIVGTYTPASLLFTAYTTTTVALSAGNHTISFTGLTSSGDNTVFIDAVALLNF